jgi:hypothetical protein
MSKFFVVEALRWGDRESHSYVIGIFSSFGEATKAGKAEVSWRGGKYEYHITEHELDFIRQEKLNNFTGE